MYENNRRQTNSFAYKKKPNINTPFKVFIYETKAVNRSQIVVDIDGDQPTVYAKGRGNVIGEFVCERITMPEPVGGIVYCSEFDTPHG